MSVANRKRMSRKHKFLEVPLTWEGQRVDDLTPSSYFRWKTVWERVAAAILLIAGLPVIALSVLLVRLTSKGPGIFRQVRVGKDGRTFLMYKIRTMAHNAEARTGAVWTQANDMRVTRVGRVLRKLHLDEFPQLVNVLRGEMSLIGPRPERPEFVHVLAKEIPGYLNRLAVLPGITGLAQINLPPDSDLDSVRRKLVLDLEYIQQASFFLDASMFFCTSIHLLGFSGDRAVRALGLQRNVTDPAARVSSPTGSSTREPSRQVSLLRAMANRSGKASMDGKSKHEAAASPKPR